MIAYSHFLHSIMLSYMAGRIFPFFVFCISLFCTFLVFLFLFSEYIFLLGKDLSFFHFLNIFLRILDIGLSFFFLMFQVLEFSVLHYMTVFFVPIIILTATFCTLSKSFLFFLVRLLCHTTADCSSTLLINVK